MLRLQTAKAVCYGLGISQDYVNLCADRKNYAVAQQLSCFAGME